MTRTILSTLCLSLLTFACSIDADDGGPQVAPDIAPDRVLHSLTPAESRDLCQAVSAGFDEFLSEEVFCEIWGATTEGDAAACGEKAAACVADLGPPDPAIDTCAEPPKFPETCQATVGDYTRCLETSMRRMQRQVDGLTCDRAAEVDPEDSEDLINLDLDHPDCAAVHPCLEALDAERERT